MQISEAGGPVAELERELGEREHVDGLGPLMALSRSERGTHGAGWATSNRIGGADSHR